MCDPHGRSRRSASAKAGPEPRGSSRGLPPRREPSGNELCAARVRAVQPPRELTQPASPRALIQRGKDRSAGFRTPKESARSREKGRDRADPSLT
ncbi:hypothetical protein M9458_052751, partial [Cirrhinus mrigala]